MAKKKPTYTIERRFVVIVSKDIAVDTMQDALAAREALKLPDFIATKPGAYLNDWDDKSGGGVYESWD